MLCLIPAQSWVLRVPAVAADLCRTEMYKALAYTSCYPETAAAVLRKNLILCKHRKEENVGIC